MTPLSLLGSPEFQQGVLNLLPRGRAWPRRLGTTLAAVAGGIGDAFAQFHVALVTLLDVESDPAQANALLPDWEADYGLPDSCAVGTPTVTERRNALLSKIASTGGQSAPYFTAIAAALGYQITITTWTAWTPWDSPWGPVTTAAWRFAWQVNAPSVTVAYFDTSSSPWDPLWAISSTELECRLTKLAPACGALWIN